MGDGAEDWRVTESWPQRIYFVIGILVLFLAGLFPEWFLPTLTAMAELFRSGGP
jgi:hypothetical protein